MCACVYRTTDGGGESFGARTAIKTTATFLTRTSRMCLARVRHATCPVRTRIIIIIISSSSSIHTLQYLLFLDPTRYNTVYGRYSKKKKSLLKSRRRRYAKELILLIRTSPPPRAPTQRSSVRRVFPQTLRANNDSICVGRVRHRSSQRRTYDEDWFLFFFFTLFS